MLPSATDVTNLPTVLAYHFWLAEQMQRILSHCNCLASYIVPSQRTLQGTSTSLSLLLGRERAIQLHLMQMCESCGNLNDRLSGELESTRRQLSEAKSQVLESEAETDRLRAEIESSASQSAAQASDRLAALEGELQEARRKVAYSFCLRILSPESLFECLPQTMPRTAGNSALASVLALYKVLVFLTLQIAMPAALMMALLPSSCPTFIPIGQC